MQGGNNSRFFKCNLIYYDIKFIYGEKIAQQRTKTKICTAGTCLYSLNLYRYILMLSDINRTSERLKRLRIRRLQIEYYWKHELANSTKYLVTKCNTVDIANRQCL